jgi:AraC-like DNA-binding protein
VDASVLQDHPQVRSGIGKPIGVISFEPAGSRAGWRVSGAESGPLSRILRSRLLSHDCSAERVADLFSMHCRTLNRRLSAEGTGFWAVVDEMRFEIARQMLAGTVMPFAQIAAALAFSEASAFTRAFRRWSGRTPTAWRAEHHRFETGRRDGSKGQVKVPPGQAGSWK